MSISHIGDKFVRKIINYGILLHASICIAAFAAIIAAPFAILDFVANVRLPAKLISEAQVISVPIVNRSEGRWDSKTGKYLCFLEIPNTEYKDKHQTVRMATPYLRSESVRGQDVLKIYSHPALVKGYMLPQRIVEVPSDTSWSSVFRAATGRSFASALLVLCLQFTFGALAIYIAIRGYFFIKSGARRRVR